MVLGPRASPQAFSERRARSLYLSGMGILIAILIAVPLGIYQAVKRNSFGDQAVTAVAVVAAMLCERASGWAAEEWIRNCGRSRADDPLVRARRGDGTKV